MFERVSQILGLFCYGFEGIGSSYLFLAPIFRGPFGTETLTTIVAWTIAAFSVAAWFALFRKESRVKQWESTTFFRKHSPTCDSGSDFRGTF